MVVAGLVAVVVVSLVVARIGLVYLDGAKKLTRISPHRVATAIDLTDDASDAPPGSSGRAWLLRGFDPHEAAAWIDHDFDPDHAYLFRSLELDAPTAARLRAAGLEDTALVTLVEEASFAHHDGRQQLITLVERAPQLAPQAIAWLRLGATADQALAYAAEGFTPAASDTWRAAGWNLDDALPWFAARFEPTPALAWRTRAFDAAEARSWKREHFGVRQAEQWRRLGDTPAQARDVERRFIEARLTVTEGLQWLDLGFSVEEICAGWPAMAAGHDTRSWRAEWQRMKLSPADVSGWHTKFGREETAQWLDAGIRDPATALRLRARGFTPETVAGVARDRLADVFNSVPVTRDDLLSAAGQLGRAGGSPEIRRRLQRAAAVTGQGNPREVAVDLIEDVLDELQRLAGLGELGAPLAAKALARRLERGLIASALLNGRRSDADMPHAG